MNRPSFLSRRVLRRLVLLLVPAGLLLLGGQVLAANYNPSIKATLVDRTIVVTGEGFPEEAKTTLSVDFTDPPTVSSLTTAKDGTFEASIAVPEGFWGKATITARTRVPLRPPVTATDTTVDDGTDGVGDGTGVSDTDPSASDPSATPEPSTPGTATPGAPGGSPGGSPGSAPTGADPGIPAPAGKAWTLAFSEEFNGSGYDRTKLTPCFDWNYGACTSTFNNGRETYRPEQVRVSNGTAKLVAEPLSPATSGCQNGSCTYKSGLLSTARPRADDGSGYLFPFTYGYVESRMKIPNKQGFFTAFWMLPTDPSYSYRSEIDILENLGGDPQSMFMTYHHSNRSGSFPVNKGTKQNGACAAIDYSQNFHRIGVDWQPTHIAWYIDGVKCGAFTNASQIENGPMQIILNLMVDVDWQRDWKVGLTDPTATAQLEVDYLRVYQAK